MSDTVSDYLGHITIHLGKSSFELRRYWRIVEKIVLGVNVTYTLIDIQGGFGIKEVSDDKRKLNYESVLYLHCQVA